MWQDYGKNAFIRKIAVKREFSQRIAVKHEFSQTYAFLQRLEEKHKFRQKVAVKTQRPLWKIAPTQISMIIIIGIVFNLK